MNGYLNTLPKSIFAGSIIGIISAVSSVAFAALIYHGELSQYLLVGASSCLIGTIVLMLVLGGFSTSKRTIGQAQDVYAAIIAVTCYDIAGKVLQINPQDVLPTVMTVTITMAMSSGFIMFLLGQLELGKLIRYFPYPVIGGFLAGTGWLIFSQSFIFLTKLPLDFSHLATLLTIDYLGLWLPPLIYAFFMIWAMHRFDHYLVLPSLLIIGVSLFYLYLWIMVIPFSLAESRGWLMGPFPKGTLANIPSLSVFSGNVQWSIISHYIPDYLILITLSVISLLLNASSFEIMSNETMNINKELKVTGIANLLTGLLGGLGGYQGLAISKINLKLKLNSRLVGIMSGVIIIFILVAGTSSLHFLPKSVFGALLIYVSLDFILEWLISIKKKISWSNYLIVLSITLVIAIQGFLTGLVVGLFLSLTLFVIHYSRIEVIRAFMSGDLIRSTVERTEQEKTILTTKGKEILIPIISGYLFFGNTAFIMNKIIDEIDKNKDYNINYLILDFSRVIGMEVSCFMSIIKLLQSCKMRLISLVFANLPPEIKKEINRFITNSASDDLHYSEFPDLDHAVEWCEDQIISKELISISPAEQFQFLTASNEENKLLLTYFERVKVKENDIIYQQGDEATDLLYLAKGKLKVVLAYGTKHEIRLSRIKQGAIVGEMGLFSKDPRSATVVATEDSILYKLSDEALERLYQEQPALGLTLDRLIIKLLGKRLLQANKFSSFVKMSL
ncbi:SLC26A/SulP transporter family protein [Legionella sp. km772]|uniref:SLC26A/SulP transporter family protein n=1 Tax=Legionella sp. km772 TaxID=2498111 RepID=UPI0013154D6B|nr:SulP family inorganic anion transporter [Legionella sp. km772]